jgi:hypothetical protein
MARDPRIVIHLESGDETVILEGEVERPHDRGVLTRFADAYEEKYAYRPEPSSQDHGIYVLRPKAAQTWTENDYPRTATRWVFPG